MFGSLSRKIAHTSALPSLGNQDLRSLQELINSEKVLLASIQKFSQDLTKSNECLKTWGSSEGNDIGDVLSNSSAILSHITNAFNEFANHENNVRGHMKELRTREEQLEELNRRRRAVGQDADAAERKLNKMGAENKNLPSQTDLLAKLRQEMRQLDINIENEDASLNNFKRKTTRSFMLLKFAGLVELAEKCTIVGELGKLIIQEIPQDVVRPGYPRAQYAGYERTVNLVAEASRCINEVAFNPTLEPAIVPKELPSYDAYSTNSRADNSSMVEPGPPGSSTLPQLDFGPPGAPNSGYGYGTATSAASSTNTNLDPAYYNTNSSMGKPITPNAFLQSTVTGSSIQSQPFDLGGHGRSFSEVTTSTHDTLAPMPEAQSIGSPSPTASKLGLGTDHLGPGAIPESPGRARSLSDSQLRAGPGYAPPAVVFGNDVQAPHSPNFGGPQILPIAPLGPALPNLDPNVPPTSTFNIPGSGNAASIEAPKLTQPYDLPTTDLVSRNGPAATPRSDSNTATVPQTIQSIRLLDPPSSTTASGKFSAFPVKSTRERKTSQTTLESSTTQVSKPSHWDVARAGLASSALTRKDSQSSNEPAKEVHHVRFAVEPSSTGSDDTAYRAAPMAVDYEEEEAPQTPVPVETEERNEPRTSPTAPAAEPHISPTAAAAVAPRPYWRRPNQSSGSNDSLPSVLPSRGATKPIAEPITGPAAIAIPPTPTSPALVSESPQDIPREQESTLSAISPDDKPSPLRTPIVISDDREANSAAALALSKEIEAMNFDSPGPQQATFGPISGSPTKSSFQLDVQPPASRQPITYTPVSAFNRERPSPDGAEGQTINSPPPPWLTPAPGVPVSAFRRPPAWSPSIPGSVEDNASPMGARRRMLPASPHPVRPGGNGSGFRGKPVPNLPLDTSVGGNGAGMTSSPTAEPGAAGDIPTSLRPGYSPMTSPGISASPSTPGAATGRPPVRHLATDELKLPEITPLTPDDDFMGLSSGRSPFSNSPRTHSPAAGYGQQQGAPAAGGGYSEGRFATNLEDEQPRRRW